MGQENSGASAASSEGVTLPTGALLANITTVLTHNLGKANYQLQVMDATNNAEVDILRVNGADPTNKIDIRVGVNISGGLNVSIIGYD